MRTLSRKEIYAMQVIVFLAEQDAGGAVRAQEIAAARNIPKNYTEQIMVLLRRDHLVNSIRGINGGHKLAKPSKEITVAQVLRAVGGPIEVVPAEHRDGPFAFLWSKVEQAIIETLDVSIDKIISQMHQHRGYPNYYI